MTTGKVTLLSAGPGDLDLLTIKAAKALALADIVLLDDLANPENELPEELRAGLISIGIWMVKEIELIRSGKANDLRAMIEITEIIRDGLK